MRNIQIFFFLLFTLLLSFNGVSQVVEENDSIRKANQPKDTTMLSYNKKQHQKMVSRGDVLFSQKEYLKSKKLYQRAIRFQPTWDNSHSEQRIIEIDQILREQAQRIEVYVKEYDEKFQQGITEERIDLKFNRYNEPIAYKIIRVVVIKDTYSIYTKHVIRSTVTYTKNKAAVTKQVWDEESNNVTLRWN